MFPDLGPDTIPECIVRVPGRTFPEEPEEQPTLLFGILVQKTEEQYFSVF